MNPNRRCFLKLASMAGIGVASSDVGKTFSHGQDEASGTNKMTVDYAVAILEDGSMLSTPFWRMESGREGLHCWLLRLSTATRFMGRR